MNFTDRLKAALQADRTQPLMEYKGRDYTRGEICDFADRVIELLDRAGVPQDAKIGVVVRNRVLHAAAMLGLIAHSRPLTTIYAMQSQEAIAAEIAESGFGAVIADAQDWSEPSREAAARTGSAGIVLSHGADGPTMELDPRLAKAGAGPFTTTEGEPALEVLSSGTTGKPKRIRFPFRLMNRTVETVTASGVGDLEPQVLTWPYGGIGGMGNLIGSTILGRHTTILDKFNVEEWVDAIRRHRPTAASGPPAVVRMVLDAKVPAEDISSLQYFYGGSAPMTPDLQDEFETTYGIKVIWAYGATEFYGTIITWTAALADEFGEAKKGSMGRALPGIQLRVVDTESGEPLAAGEVGYLAALVPSVKDDWIITTDLALIDEDGFVFHKGRGDGAIVRGGFKVLPEKIVEALQKHPAVLDAGVVGLPDPRVGEVPVAAVELRAGVPRPTEEELRAHAKQHLVVHHVPAQIMIVDVLPRTTSLKVDLGGVRRLFQERVPAA